MDADYLFVSDEINEAFGGDALLYYLGLVQQIKGNETQTTTEGGLNTVIVFNNLLACPSG